VGDWDLLIYIKLVSNDKLCDLPILIMCKHINEFEKVLEKILPNKKG